MTTAKPMPISIRVFLSRFIVFPPLGQTDYRKSILGNDWFSIRISLKTKSSARGWIPLSHHDNQSEPNLDENRRAGLGVGCSSCPAASSFAPPLVIKTRQTRGKPLEERYGSFDS